MGWGLLILAEELQFWVTSYNPHSIAGGLQAIDRLSRPQYTPAMKPNPPLRPSRDVVAANVRTQRKARGLTQAALAALAGVYQPRIAEIEAGRYDFKAGTLDTIAAALAVSPDSLLISVDSEILSE